MTRRNHYRGDGSRPEEASKAAWENRPDLYEPLPALVNAVNVALILGRPLLVTGEPGTGKTELASAVAWELGLDPPLRFDTRSTSESKQLFYTFDALARFQVAQFRESTMELDPRHFLEFQALGLAILRTKSADEARGYLRPGSAHPHVPTRSVVLVDEIDKAPRDFPNDLLGAIERMAFTVTELQAAELAADDLRPIVIVTSNSERALPEAFLRRCVYHDVAFPRGEHLGRIVERRVDVAVRKALNASFDTGLVDAVLPLFEALRDAGLRKKPATAELIDWVTALHDRLSTADFVLSEDAAWETIGAVVKRQEDLETARAALKRHFAGGSEGS